MIEDISDSDDKLKLLKEDLQRARAEQEAQRALRKAEIGAEKQARDEAARGRSDDMMGQLRAIRQLLGEQRESQTERVEQMERRHAEEVRRHETMLGHMSDIQAQVTSLRDDGRAHSEQIAQERARAKSDVETVRQVFEIVVETQEELRSRADELLEDSTRRHEELQHILLANASARESVSLSDPALGPHED